jgi:hypothetical protein
MYLLGIKSKSLEMYRLLIRNHASNTNIIHGAYKLWGDGSIILIKKIIGF